MGTFVHNATRRLRDRWLLSAEDFEPAVHPQGTEYVLVHNPGKVGSKSIVETLERNVPKARVFHTHTLSLEHLGRAEALMPGLFDPSFRPIETSWKVRRIYLRHRGRLGWKVFCAFRDPVARDLSLYFELVHHRHPASAFTSGEMTLERTRDELHDFIAGGTDLEYMPPQVDWFDVELQGFLGFPVYEAPFEIERGWSEYANGHGDALVIMPMERIDEVLPAAAGALGLNVSSLHRTNDARGKVAGGNPWYMHYETLRREPRLPAGYLDAQLESRFVRHFFSEAQRAAIETRWRPFSP